jgi:8-oxo-dGTP pyrophosphatase MutT (NUDIX family)
MDKSQTPLLVSALIVTRKNDDGATEILNVLAHNKTKYGFPGGKVEDGETPEQAVIRETIEELGVEPIDIVPKGMYSALTPEGRKIDMYVFTGSVSGDIGPNAEIAELHWLTYQQMSENLDILTPMTIEHVLPLLKDL